MKPLHSRFFGAVAGLLLTGIAVVGWAAPTITAQPANSSVCAGGTATFAAAASGTNVTYQWQVSPSGTGGPYTNLANGGVYSGVATSTLTITGAMASMTGYAYRLQATDNGTTSSNAAVLTTQTAPAFGSQPADAAICPAGTATFTAGAGSATYRWQVAPAYSSSFTDLIDGGVYAGTTTGTLTVTAPANTLYGSQYRLSAINTCGTTYSNAVRLTFRTTWTGATSTVWNTGSNWSCGAVPADTFTDVVISSAPVNQPVITATSVVRNITLNSGSTLTVAGSVTLSLAGGITNLGGTLNASATNATVNYNSIAPNQPIAGGTYHNIQFNGSGNKVLAGDVTVNGAANILTNNRIFLGSYNFTLGSSATIAAGSTRYWVTNGSGGLKKLNLSTTPFVFPLGTTTSYTPFQLNNSGGVTDNFTGRLTDSVYASYVNDVPQGAAITTKVVHRTYYLVEDVPGGSNAQLIVQWNQSDEATGFNRSAISFAHYVGGKWVSSTAQSATGATGPGPYIITLNGITSFSPFGLGSAGSPLPVAIQDFGGAWKGGHAALYWYVGTESDVARYEVERSADGREFTAVGTVPASGAPSYAFTDRTAVATAAYYYRLRVVDAGGDAGYSNTVLIAAGAAAPESAVTLMENPLSQAVTIEVARAREAGAVLSVYDLGGRPLLTQPFAVQPGRQRITVPVTGLPAGGPYLIRVELDGATHEFKATKR